MTIFHDLKALHEYAFGIVDAAMVEHLPEGLCAEPLVPKKLAQSAHLMPTLIDLRRTPADRLNVLLDGLKQSSERGEPPAVAFFIKTDSTLTEIARHWNVLQIAEPQRERKLWLRLHDPRVLHQMLRVLDPMQRRKLFGSSQAFIYWVGGEWVTAARELIPGPGNQVLNTDVVAPYAGPAKWNWNRIERIGLVNRALLGAGISEAAVLTSQGALAEQLMERAVGRHALSEPADLVEFAVRGLQTNPGFDEHRDVVRAIRPDDTRTNDSSLADRFALIDEQVWSSLRQPTNSSGDKNDDFSNKVRVL
jgi:hypothetical protein